MDWSPLYRWLLPAGDARYYVYVLFPVTLPLLRFTICWLRFGVTVVDDVLVHCCYIVVVFPLHCDTFWYAHWCHYCRHLPSPFYVFTTRIITLSHFTAYRAIVILMPYTTRGDFTLRYYLPPGGPDALAADTCSAATVHYRCCCITTMTVVDSTFNGDTTLHLHTPADCAHTFCGIWRYVAGLLHRAVTTTPCVYLWLYVIVIRYYTAGWFCDCCVDFVGLPLHTLHYTPAVYAFYITLRLRSSVYPRLLLICYTHHRRVPRLRLLPPVPFVDYAVVHSTLPSFSTPHILPTSTTTPFSCVILFRVILFWCVILGDLRCDWLIR